MTVSAEKESRNIISLAERQLEQARVKIERDREAFVREKSMIIPSWIGDKGIAIKPITNNSSISSDFIMQLGMVIDTRIKAFSLLHTKTKTLPSGRSSSYQETVRWDNETDEHKLPIPYLDNYHQIMVWVPFNPVTGAFNYRGAVIRSGEYYLPHLTEERCCMELQGLPKAIIDYKTYVMVKDAINRGNSEVNLMSLLCRYKEWHPDIQSQVPKQVKIGLIDTGLYNRAVNLPESYFTGATRISVDVEAMGVFDVEGLRRRREASGEGLDVVISPVPVEDQLVEAEMEPAGEAEIINDFEGDEEEVI